jgi:hypothetical protein
MACPAIAVLLGQWAFRQRIPGPEALTLLKFLLW